MLGPFFAVAARSARRRRTLRAAATAHLLLTALAAAPLLLAGPRQLATLGQTLLLSAIVEGALLLGWRLTQLPRSQALEFLLVSPVQPHRVYLAEALVGLTTFALVTLSGLPVLLFLVYFGKLWPLDVGFFLVVPFTWGAITGLTLTAWAYEPLGVRRWVERVLLVLILLYLLIGVLAAEKVQVWLTALPTALASAILSAFEGFHRDNPFTVMQDWCQFGLRSTWERAAWLQAGATAFVVFVLLRAAARLKGHFHERHYGPRLEEKDADRGHPGDRPLSWWAVRRVTEYAGRVNIYVAGGFGFVYAVYLLAGPQWPTWLGRRAFEIVEIGLGGVPGVVTGLVILSAVPAAFQYGLWDSSAQERAKKMELLLLTELDGEDYALAAFAAAVRRGRGYVLAALVLLAAAIASGHVSGEQALAVLASGFVLWSLYYTVGFWSFARGIQANGFGSLLTLGLPLVAFLLAKLAGPAWLPLVPPGAVYASLTQPVSWPLLACIAGYAVLTLLLIRHTRRHADAFLRRWYDRNHGRRSAE
jgi:hypothetical protein